MNQTFRQELTWLGTFRDKRRESAYESYIFKRQQHSLLPNVIVAYLLFLFLDLPLFYFNRSGRLELDFFVWFLGVVFFTAAFFLLGRFCTYRSYTVSITLAEASFSPLYAVLLLLHGKTDFLYIALCTVLLLILLFAIPNKWAYTAVCALLLAGTVGALTPLVSLPPAGTEILSGWLYIGCALLLAGACAWRFDYQRHVNFLDSQSLNRRLNTDTLTGAFTRPKFDREIKRQIDEAQGNGSVFSLAIFDVDDFKKINDTYGHLTGDRILTGITGIVRSSMPSRNTITRWGGEEFVIVCPGTDVNSAILLCERLRCHIAEKAFPGGIHVTCSFGVSEYRPGDTAFILLERADRFLYDAKSLGKNAVVSGYC